MMLTNSTSNKTKLNSVLALLILTTMTLIFIQTTHQLSNKQNDLDINSTDDVISTLARKFKNKDKCLKNPYTFKMLLYYRRQDIQYDTTHTLNKLTYKNLVLTNYEVASFLSPNPYSSDEDEYFDSGSYLMTFLYSQLFTACLNRSLLCTHSQFIREYQTQYPEIDFSIPKIVLDHFVDIKKSSENCILFLTDPILRMEDSAWVCHDDLNVLYKFQEALSEKIRYTNKQYDFFIHYIQDNSAKVPGVLQLLDNKLMFIRRDRKILLDLSYDKITPYVISMYMKDTLPWSGVIIEKPEEARCFKIERKDRKNMAEYFCVYYSRNDIAMRKMLSTVEARWLSEMFVIKINNRLQKALLNKSIQDISKLRTPAMDLDDSLLIPIKNQIRNDYFLGRHQLVNYVKLSKLMKNKYESEISNLKTRVINKVCNSILICIKAVDYCLEKGLLPLNGKQERIAMDDQNPYNSLIPKSYLKIPFPNAGTLGRELIEKILKLKPGKTKIEPIPEAQAGEVPNSTSIKKAFNSFFKLKDKTLKFSNIEQLGNNCRTNVRLNANYLKRKVSLLFWMSKSDPFFKNMANIRNTQFVGSVDTS